jgi:hypothetical protein
MDIDLIAGELWKEAALRRRIVSFLLPDSAPLPRRFGAGIVDRVQKDLRAAFSCARLLRVIRNWVGRL